MKIERLSLSNFMIFNEIDVDFSPNINIICGENSTGKTALLKLLYSITKATTSAPSVKSDPTKERMEDAIASKLQGVFRPDKFAVGRLVNRIHGSNRTDICVNLDTAEQIRIGFSNRQKTRVELHSPLLSAETLSSAVYIPPKEIISSSENFVSLYDDYHIAFEETYYDLARLLERPLKKGANTAEQKAVLDSFEKIVDGTIVQRDKSFFLKIKGSGEFEMGLVSEGYRKLSTIMYLILSGSLSRDSILFWDEPETNMNPKMIRPIVNAILELAKLGVQVFVTTHDYFVQQCFNLAASYPQKDTKHLTFQFISLYRDAQGVSLESSADLSALTNNAIMEEFDQLYDREQVLIYGNH